MFRCVVIFSDHLAYSLVCHLLTASSTPHTPVRTHTVAILRKYNSPGYSIVFSEKIWRNFGHKLKLAFSFAPQATHDYQNKKETRSTTTDNARSYSDENSSISCTEFSFKNRISATWNTIGHRKSTNLKVKIAQSDRIKRKKSAQIIWISRLTVSASSSCD